MFSYDFKRVDELVWALVTAAVIAAAQIVQETDFNAVTDWKIWAIAAAGAVARAVVAALGTFLAKNLFKPAEPPVIEQPTARIPVKRTPSDHA